MVICVPRVTSQHQHAMAVDAQGCHQCRPEETGATGDDDGHAPSYFRLALMLRGPE
jgi:hypothetical protein